MLPPAGQIFEKWHLLENFVIFLMCFVTFKQGSSRGAASGGSDFQKWVAYWLFVEKWLMGCLGFLQVAYRSFQKWVAYFLK